MKTYMKRILAVLLCCVMVLSGCGGADKPGDPSGSGSGSNASGNPAGSSEETTETETTIDPGEFLQDVNFSENTGSIGEEEYIKRHLNFLTSRTYQEMVDFPGGDAASIAEGYYESAQRTVNSFWEHFSEIGLLIGGGEYTLKNEYDILVGALLQSTSMRENFEESGDRAMMLNITNLLEAISGTLQNTKAMTALADPDKIEEYDTLAKNLDGILDGLSNAVKKSSGKDETISLYQDAWEGAKEQLGLAFDAKDQTFLKAIMGGLGAACDLSDFASGTNQELMDEYVLLNSTVSAGNEYYAVWSIISAELNKSDNPEAKKIGKSLDDYLVKLDEAKQDFEGKMREKLFKAAGGNLFKVGLGHMSDAFDTLLDAHPFLAAIRQGLSGGITLANGFTNMDDIAYNGKMYMGAGLMAKAAHEAMATFAMVLQEM